MDLTKDPKQFYAHVLNNPDASVFAYMTYLDIVHNELEHPSGIASFNKINKLANSLSE